MAYQRPHVAPSDVTISGGGDRSAAYDTRIGAVIDGGYENFSLGTLGNAGHNLYVSRGGALQRIAYSDVTGNGYVDIPFANTHDDAVVVPTYYYPDPVRDGSPVELESEGTYAMAVGDLNGDGYDDVVLANQYNGATNEVHARVYYGGPEGFGPKRMIRLWAPSSKDVAIGAFEGPGRPSLVFASRERLRLFRQDEFGFRPDGYSDIPVPAPIESFVVGDLDQDGFDDLIIRSQDSSIRIYWGGPDGLDGARFLTLDRSLTGDAEVGPGLDLASIGAAGDQPARDAEQLGGWRLFVAKVPEAPRIKVVLLRGIPRLFLCPKDEALFCSFNAAREVEDVFQIGGGPYVSAAAGPVGADDSEDLVLISRNSTEEKKGSWIYWDGRSDGIADRYSEARRTGFVTESANDATLADLDGSGQFAVVVCQDKSASEYSTSSQVLRFSAPGAPPEVRSLPTLCALDVAAVRRPSEPDGVVFANHRAETALGHIDSPIYVGDADGYRSDRRIDLRGWGACEIKFVDLFDAGRPDVLMANSNENDSHNRHPSYIFRGAPGGPHTGCPVELPTHRAVSTVVADFDRSGYLDIVVASWGADPALNLFRGTVDGFQGPEPISMFVSGKEHRQPRFMATGDLNQNGWLDLVVPVISGDGGALIYWGGPGGFSAERAELLDCGRIVCANMADLDGDGWLDLVVGQFKGPDPYDEYTASVFIYWGGPNGFSNNRRAELPASFPTDITIADFNNDGNLDMFVSNYYGWRTRDIDSYLYWGRPDGMFDPTTATRLPHHSAHGSLAADFDEDGFLDLAVANHREAGNHPSNSFVWWNGQDGFAPDRRTLLPTRGPHGITHTDLGNLIDRGWEEHFTSRPIEVPVDAPIEEVRWHGLVPPKTWVRAQLRRATSIGQLADAAWCGPTGPGSWFEGADTPRAQGNEPAMGGVVQYRLALGAVNSCSTPRIEQVELRLGRHSQSDGTVESIADGTFFA